MTYEERLKKRLDFLNRNSTYGLVDIKALREEIEQLKKENEHLKKENEHLKKENEHLKKENQELRDKFFLF